MDEQPATICLSVCCGSWHSTQRELVYVSCLASRWRLHQHNTTRSALSRRRAKTSGERQLWTAARLSRDVGSGGAVPLGAGCHAPRRSARRRSLRRSARLIARLRVAIGRCGCREVCLSAWWSHSPYKPRRRRPASILSTLQPHRSSSVGWLQPLVGTSRLIDTVSE